MPDSVVGTDFSVAHCEIIQEFKLEQLNKTDNIDDVLITTNEVNRTGLPLAGFFDYFQNARIQIIGRAENTYLNKLHKKTLKKFRHWFCQEILSHFLK